MSQFSWSCWENAINLSILFNIEIRHYQSNLVKKNYLCIKNLQCCKIKAYNQNIKSYFSKLLYWIQVKILSISTFFFQRWWIPFSYSPKFLISGPLFDVSFCKLCPYKRPWKIPRTWRPSNAARWSWDVIGKRPFLGYCPGDTPPRNKMGCTPSEFLKDNDVEWEMLWLHTTSIYHHLSHENQGVFSGYFYILFIRPIEILSSVYIIRIISTFKWTFYWLLLFSWYHVNHKITHITYKLNLRHIILTIIDFTCSRLKMASNDNIM